VRTRRRLTSTRHLSPGLSRTMMGERVYEMICQWRHFTVVPQKASEPEDKSGVTPSWQSPHAEEATAEVSRFRHLGVYPSPYSRQVIYTTQIHSYSPARVLLSVRRRVSERGNPDK
jgi:hypothetical protein